MTQPAVAESSTVEAFRKSFCEPVALYGVSAFAVHGFQTHIRQVEVARNDAARASTGYLKAIKVPKLRALVGMRILRDIGETEATLVMEKSLRMHSNTPVVRASHAQVLKSERKVGSWREASTYHLPFPTGYC